MPLAGDMPQPRHPWLGHQWYTASGALVAEAAAGIDAVTVFRHLAGRRHLVFLDSAMVDAPTETGRTAAAPRLGRYSFVAADPIHVVEVPADGDAAALDAAFARVRGLLGDLACPTIPGLPPFQGGIAGLVAYEAGLVRLGVAAPHDRAGAVPLLALAVYDVVFAFDHDLAAGWFISQGVPAAGGAARRHRAAERLAALCAPPATIAPPAAAPPAAPLPVRADHPLPGYPGVRSTHSAASYEAMVAAGIDFIRAGDVFQVNLAQRFAVATPVDAVTLTLLGRRLNAAPFAAYFDAGPLQVASMSPERFLQVTRGVVRMHPIKGTRPVLERPEADLYAGADLGTSGKDRAENVMIVDLVRNDLSRVCRPETVRVEALCRLERYRYVQHLVSIVAGRLRPGLGAIDALEAAIPGGSVTGAPKHRACEIIAQLEGVARGCYCGSIGYVGFDGAADFNLLIRSFVVAGGGLTFAAGGGITAASQPSAEHAESLHKAEGMLRVLAALERTGEPAP